MNEFFEEGYTAGLVNERDCPYALTSIAAWCWYAGNDVGVRIHCAVVEAVYLSEVA